MTLALELVGKEWEAGESSWTSTRALLYALGVGAGAEDPLRELDFTTENSHDVIQRVLPTFAVVAGADAEPGPRLGDFDGTRILHAEQSTTLHRELPTEATIRTTSRVAGMYDKGKDALIVLESSSFDAATGEPLFDTRIGMFVRGEGGFGGERGSSERWQAPDRPADHVVTYDTRRDQALLYRLSGDRNPLHADPWFAQKAGLSRPILHGLCTYGFTGRALLHTVCDSDPGRFGTMAARFSAPVLPGQTLEIHIWEQEAGQASETHAAPTCSFRTKVGDTVVLDRGTFTTRAA